MNRGNVNKSNTDELLWVIVFIFVGIIALWYFGHEKFLPLLCLSEDSKRA